MMKFMVHAQHLLPTWTSCSIRLCMALWQLQMTADTKSFSSRKTPVKMKSNHPAYRMRSTQVVHDVRK